MKREILCLECADANRKLFPSDEPYPGEYVKFVQGLALLDFNCDLCARDILKGSDCVAFTISTDRVPYRAWEHFHIEIKEPTDD